MSETLGGMYETIKITERLQLHQLQLSDTDVLFALVDNDREHLDRWLPWVKHTRELADTALFIDSTLQSRNEGSAYEYGIILDDKIIGHVSLMHLTDGLTPEIGYWISSSAAGHGITTETVKALTKFGFETLSLNAIVVKAEPENIGSNKVAEHNGYVLTTTEQDKRVGKPVNVWTKTRDSAQT